MARPFEKGPLGPPSALQKRRSTVCTFSDRASPSVLTYGVLFSAPGRVRQADLAVESRDRRLMYAPGYSSLAAAGHYPTCAPQQRRHKLHAALEAATERGGAVCRPPISLSLFSSSFYYLRRLSLSIRDSVPCSLRPLPCVVRLGGFIRHGLFT